MEIVLKLISDISRVIYLIYITTFLWYLVSLMMAPCI
jgi:hypothetical protein